MSTTNDQYFNTMNRLYDTDTPHYHGDCDYFDDFYDQDTVMPVPSDQYEDDYTDDIEVCTSPSPAEKRASRPQPLYQTQHSRMFDETDECEIYHNERYRSDSAYNQPHANPNFYDGFSHDQPSYHQYGRNLDIICENETNNFATSQHNQTLHHPSRPRTSFNPPAPMPVRPSANDEWSNPSYESNRRNSYEIRLRPVSILPDMYRGIFKFGVFNAIQSACFDDISNSNENMVISAPTGSGKTVLFELAIIRMLTESKNTGKTLRCVYMAPTKALCSERYRDWAMKFDPLGIKCCELTGDTVQFGKGAWGDARNALIIITTGEKWDSLTRNWRDNYQILSQINLFLVDEVHILNESRGSTLEVVVSRMKTRGSSVRFILVSATVPNIDDIASWIGCSSRINNPAKVFEFGEEFRPCKLTRIVIGVYRQKGQNDFVFTKHLDYKLFGALQEHSVGKPILVFCSTRKGVFTTAEQLLKDYINAEKNKQILPWSHPARFEQSFHDKRLTEFASFGIGVHHAGLTLDDRRTTEDLYLKKILRVVIATSTLAVGVNLPAHLVVIKGVQTFQNNASVEYSDLDIMQMLGRAGRPQFDKDGIAIILCEQELENKYKALVQGKTVLESSLHANLSEHLNSEIGLGTITNIASAKEWLRGSFLFQRIRKNPKHYSLGKEDDQTWEERVDDLVMHSVEKLQQTQLIVTATEGSEYEKLVSTEYGDIMSKFYIRQSTMGLILALPEYPTLRETLEMLAASEELSDIKMRASEKTALNKLRKHLDIRFEIKRLERASDKVFLLIQAVLGGISLNSPEYKSADSQPQLEAFGIFRHICRIARATVEVGVVKKFGAQVKHGLELVRCLTAKAWEDRPVVLRQIEQIGEKSVKVLAEHSITSFEHLRKQDALRIENLLNRHPPFGLEVLALVQEFPQYLLKITQLGISSNGGKGPVEAELSIECGLAAQLHLNSKKQKGRNLSMTAVLILTSDMALVDFRRISTRALTKERKTFEVIVELTKPSQSVMAFITCETIAGLTVTEVYKPKISPKEYPTLQTRPPTITEMDLAGLEDDPDFWNMDIDEEHDCDTPIRDLTDARHPSGFDRDNEKRPKLSHGFDRPSKKLSNGNYECNHACKDKTKCRHLCCRDGLPEKSQASKKRALMEHRTIKSGSLPGQSATVLAPTLNTLSRKATDRKIGEFESLRERTNVANSSKLSPGHRLKLSSSGQLKRKRKPIPDFKIEFADLRDCQGSETIARNTADTDDEELPEANDLLKAVCTIKSPPSETNYSNSDVDSLIRAIPLDDEIVRTTSAVDNKNRHGDTEGSIVLSTPLLQSKQNEVIRMLTPPRKRRRHSKDKTSDVPVSPVNVYLPLSSPETLSRLDSYTPDDLFIPTFDDSDQEIWRYQELNQPDNRGEYSLDSNCIGICHATPDLTMSTGTVPEFEDQANGSNTRWITEKGMDEFDELDAFLNSEAVEIV